MINFILGLIVGEVIMFILLVILTSKTDNTKIYDGFIFTNIIIFYFITLLFIIKDIVTVFAYDVSYTMISFLSIIIIVLFNQLCYSIIKYVVNLKKKGEKQ